MTIALWRNGPSAQQKCNAVEYEANGRTIGVQAHGVGEAGCLGTTPGWTGTHHASVIVTVVTLLSSVFVSLMCLATQLVDIQRSAYFNVDDFDNVYWTYNLSPRDMLAALLDPTFSFFRPVGMFWYWLLGRAFNLDPAVFHAFQSGFSLLNVALVSLLTLSLTRNLTAALLTPVLWITSVALLEALWWFASVFVIVSTTWILLALLAYIHLRNTVARFTAVVAVYLLAIKSQELAVTLPAVLLAYEVIVLGRMRTDIKSRAALYSLLGIIALVFTYLKSRAMAGNDPSTGYVFAFRLDHVYQNAIWYAAQLFPWMPAVNPALALLPLVAVSLVGLVLRDRIVLFGLVFVAITFLPVIFLVDHLFGFYWYLPGVGVWLCIGQFGGRLAGLATRQLGSDWLGRTWIVPAVLLAVSVVLIQIQTADYETSRVAWTRCYAGMFRDYVESVVAQPDPPPGAELDISGAPQAFDSEGLTTLYRVLYNRQDITARRLDAAARQRWDVGQYC